MIPYSYLAPVGRLLLALMFILSALGKIAEPAATQGFIASVGLPLSMLAYLGAIVIELGGGILLLLGFQARATSLLLAGFTLLAAVVFHHDFANQNEMIHFLKNLAIVGGLLHIAAGDAGALSLDHRRLNRT
ncbi:MAG: DoxX family protein [Roseococcus sp.]|nr:DoxX family protein [Roseococcus sp.]